MNIPPAPLGASAIGTFIFDLDGTLADTLDGIAVCMNDVLARRGLPTHERDAYRRMIGNGVHKLVERALPDDQRHRATDFLAEYLPHLQQRGTELATLYEGIPQMLDALAERGVTMAVLSNKPHDATVDVVKHLLDGWPWRIVRGHVEGTPVKPDPTTALQICDELGVAPDGVFYVGDSNVDMDLATHAGFIGLGAGWGIRGRAELEAHGARHVFDSPGQLVDWMRRGNT